MTGISRSIDDLEILNLVDLALRVNHTLFNAIGQTGGTARVQCSLAAVQNSPLHLLVRVERHFLRISADNDILKAFALSENIVA
jgi:hypothetical protein